jgi:ABC-type multidrug transport system fused ATPase/permease subunit
MQKLIRKSFAPSTLIVIAHRLENILDFDRVVVLESGRVVESGDPKILMTLPSSRFRNLVDGSRTEIDEDDREQRDISA